MIADKAISVLAIFSLNFSMIRADFMIVGVYLLLFPYLCLTNRRHAIFHLLVASVLACIYIFIAHGQYGYNRELLVISGYSIYPLFAWAVGLFGVYLMYAHWVPAFRRMVFLKKIVFFSAIYWTLLFVSEILAYHFFNFRNIATSAYSGLPLLNCIHVPDWMKAFYLLNGPAYFLVCELLGLPCPNTARKELLQAAET
ncbi:MAG: hypothetical protein HGA70_03315 [Chlorobiaceae bacterium]|nr:hypothetical protein [Chlorobiaceae bacterium]